MITARILKSGYLPRSVTVDGVPSSRPVRIQNGYVGVYCEACEWSVQLSRRLGVLYVENVRRRHLILTHGDLLRSGAMVVDPSLAS